MPAQYTDHTARVHGHHPAYGPPTGPEPPPPGSPLPYTPLPERRGMWPTVLLLIAALAIPGAIGLVVLLGGGDSSAETNETTTNETRTDETTAKESTPKESTPDETTPKESTPDETEIELAGPTVEGDGYSYKIPDSWYDVPARNVENDPKNAWIDTMSGPADADGDVYRGVVTEVQNVAPDATAQRMVATWRDNVGYGVGSTPEAAEGTTIAGEPALGVRAEYDRDGVELVLRGYLVVREGTLYSIAYRTEVTEEREGARTFDAVLESWSWGGDTRDSAV